MPPVKAGTLITLLICGLASCGNAQEHAALDAITPAAIDAHLRFLSDDILKGRAPGTPGSRLAALYIATQFEQSGLLPAVDDTSFLQQVPVLSLHSQPDLSFRARGGAQHAPELGTDYVASSGTPHDSSDLNTELVFVGHGISAPDRGWDDYAGADVSGSVVLMLANDPGAHLSQRFRGDTLTYYGTETYKRAEARRRGAAGALLIHTVESVGYEWEVVRGSWSGRRLMLADAGDAAVARLEGWLSRGVAETVLAMAGFDFATLLESARSPGFRPIRTGVTVSASGRSRVESLTDANVAGVIRGGDAELRDEVVIYTAHYDHLGIGPSSDGDSIYNGAYDNASGAALLLILADAFARLSKPPARSVLFLALTGGDAERLGAAHYLRQPLVPPSATVGAIDIDGVNLWGRTEDVVVLGHEMSTIGEWVSRAAEEEEVRVVADWAPQRGALFRSDLFRFLRAGIPSVGVQHGIDFLGRPPGWGRQALEEYHDTRYHRPEDEYRADFDYGGAVQQGRFAFRLGLRMAEAARRPEMRVGFGGNSLVRVVTPSYRRAMMTFPP